MSHKKAGGCRLSHAQKGAHGSFSRGKEEVSLLSLLFFANEEDTKKVSVQEALEMMVLVSQTLDKICIKEEEEAGKT